MPRRKSEKLALPEVERGDWQGEVLGKGTVHLGQVVQDGPPRQTVEFSYVVVPAAFTMPTGGFTWPGMLLIFVPTPMKTVFVDAGCLIRSASIPALTVSLEVTRAQFSDLIGFLDVGRIRTFQFTVGAGNDGSWLIQRWGLTVSEKQCLKS